MFSPSQIFNQLLNFLLPRFCVHCGKFGHYLCQDCYNKIEFISEHCCPACRRPAIDGFTHATCLTNWGIDAIMSAAKYQGSVRSLVKKLKYKPYAIKAYEEIDLILRRYFTEPEQLFPNNAILIPIPLHPKKLQKRGFNQAEFVAQTLSSIWKLPIQKDLLQRTRQGVDQTSLSRKERIKNVHGLYRINPQTEESLRGKRFILVDDVTTTGATLKKCARLLKQNGANKVWGATFARD